MIRIDIVTLFPDMCRSVLAQSVIGRAAREGLFELQYHNIRDYTQNRQRQVDDYPYGGGHGMILQADPIARCLDAVLAQHRAQARAVPRVVFMAPAGTPYNQNMAKELAAQSGLVLVCGHYEGIDQRVIDEYGGEEVSVGDFVLSGGELAALAVADSVLRLQPGVLKSEEGYIGDSFYEGLLEYPQYSRPQTWRGREVPAVLLSGHAANICAWRLRQSVARTRRRRPDLYLQLPADVASPPAKPPRKKKR